MTQNHENLRFGDFAISLSAKVAKGSKPLRLRVLLQLQVSAGTSEGGAGSRGERGAGAGGRGRPALPAPNMKTRK